jgi:RNA recognition motif-containing protein
MTEQTKIFVGNLPFSATEAELSDFFAAAGTVVEVHIVTDKFTGRSRGFGFVTFDSTDAVAKAVAELNDRDFGGRKISVSEAKPKERE